MIHPQCVKLFSVAKRGKRLLNFLLNLKWNFIQVNGIHQILLIWTKLVLKLEKLKA